MCPDRKPFITALKLISIVLLAALIIAIIVKGTEFLTYQDHDQQKQYIHQWKAGLNSLCLSCPWLSLQGYWKLDSGNCYFFSKYKKNWVESVKACTYMGAQPVVIKSNEQQSFLQGISRKKGNFWMGLLYNNKETSPLQGRNYWPVGEPKKQGVEYCKIISENGRNAIPCSREAFWICKKPAMPCPK